MTSPLSRTSPSEPSEPSEPSAAARRTASRTAPRTVGTARGDTARIAVARGGAQASAARINAARDGAAGRPRTADGGRSHALARALARVDLHPLRQGAGRRKAAASVVTGALLLWVVLAAVPSSAAAQTTRLATPTKTAFTTGDWDYDWYAPAPGAPISNPFGEPNDAYAAGYHTGVDFAVDEGTPVLAVASATVVSAGDGGAYGNEIVLRLADGHFAQYAHLSEIDVNAGESVVAGQMIGASGSTGNATGPHLHFEIRNSDTYGDVTDPIDFLSAHDVTDF